MSELVPIPLPLLQDKRLSLSDVKVYAAIAHMSGESRKCSSTREEIQKVSDVQRVSRYTRSLDKYGYIRIEKSGDGNRNTYTLIAGNEVKKDQISLKDYEKEYLEFSSSKHSRKTCKTNRTAFREFLKIVGNKPLVSIGVREIEQFLILKKKEASDWTARKYYGSLAAAFENAVRWEYLKNNPFKKVAKPKPPETQPLYFSEEEFNTLIRCIHELDFCELCITAVHTGLRLGELLSLQWNSLNFTLKIVQVKNTETFTTKSGKNRNVPMNEELFNLLQHRKNNIRNESNYVFSDPRGKQLKESTTSQKFKRYVRRAHLNDKLHFHSMRHTFASCLVGKGVPIYSVQKLLGHASCKTTEVYSHLLPEQMHKEVNVLTGVFKINI